MSEGTDGTGRVYLTRMTHRLLLRTFVAQLAAVTKICPQPRQNTAAAKRGTKMASSDTDDDVSLIGVLLSGTFVNECKKKANKRNRSIWCCRWIEQRDKQPRYKAKSKQQLPNQRSAFSTTCCTD